MAQETYMADGNERIWVDRRRHKTLAIGLLILAVGAASMAVLGPLVAGVIQYHASEGAVSQVVGGDIAALVLVTPTTIMAGILVWQGHRAGPILALGPALYALYMYTQLALGGDVLRYEGNSEMFFPLYLGLFLLAGVIVIRSWALIDPQSLAPTRTRLDRAVATFLLVVAFFLAVGLHLPGLVDAWASQPTSTEYLADPVVFWLVKFMDLGLVVPGLVVAGIGILRGRPWATRLRYAAVGWAALLGASVAGMAIVMQASGDPAATTANTVAFSTFAVVAMGLAWAVHRPVLQSG